MDHPDWPAFVSAILANPDDDTVRLVAADFLEENGDPDRAAFIRVQCALTRLDVTGGGRSPEAGRLRTKERTYLGPLSHFRLLWAAEACPELVRVKPPARGTSLLTLPQVEGAECVEWDRGFVERINCSAAEWLRHGAAVRARQPVRRVSLTRCDGIPRDEWYANLAALRGLREVIIGSHQHGGEMQFDAWLKQWLPGTKLLWAGEPGA